MADSYLKLALHKRLVSSGMIRYERRTILAVVKVELPAHESTHKLEVRRRVIHALVE